MTVPVWMLLGFAGWTVLLLLGTVGVYRWSRILTGTVPIRSFRADQIEGAEWYRRAMRAHANCIENLPVFGAIVFALYVGNISGGLVDKLAIAILIARVLQSLVHVGLLADERGGVDPLRVLLRADRRLSLADRDRGHQAGLKTQTTCDLTGRPASESP